MIPPLKKIVEVSDLGKTFSSFFLRRKVHALNGISLTINQGNIFAILGPNGAGKSTFLKLLLGQLFPTQGAIKIEGLNPTDPILKARLGYMPEHVSFWPHFTAKETLHFFGKLHGLTPNEIETRSIQLFEMLGIAHAAHRQCSEYSHGMRKRLGLAIALIHDPDILILDEPTAGMDPLGCREFKDLILTLSRRGKTIILTSHLLADVQDVCSHAAIFYGGIILQQGLLKDLLVKKEELVLKFSLNHKTDEKIILEDIEKIKNKYDPIITHGEFSLEALFLNLIKMAKSNHSTSGAESGTGVATFLETDVALLKTLTGKDLPEEKESIDHQTIKHLEIEDELIETVAEIDHSAIDALTKSK